jgi:hypothetical protein
VIATEHHVKHRNSSLNFNQDISVQGTSNQEHVFAVEGASITKVAGTVSHTRSAQDFSVLSLMSNQL